MWYVVENSTLRGPYTLSQIRRLRAAFELTGEKIVANQAGQQFAVDDLLPEFRTGPLRQALAAAHSPAVAVPPPIIATPPPAINVESHPVQQTASGSTRRSPHVSEPQRTDLLTEQASHSKFQDWEYVTYLLFASFTLLTCLTILIGFAAGPNGREMRLGALIVGMFSGAAAIICFILSIAVNKIVELQAKVGRMEVEVLRLRQEQGRRGLD
jgi:hypothetical protein